MEVALERASIEASCCYERGSGTFVLVMSSTHQNVGKVYARCAKPAAKRQRRAAVCASLTSQNAENPQQPQPTVCALREHA